MIRVESVLGSRIDPAFHEKIHELELQCAMEFITIQASDLDRRRLMARTNKGEEVAIALPRDQKLYDGAVLLLNAHRAIVVRAGVQRWLRLSPQSASAALDLGYHAGNLHWRVRFDGDDLLVAQDDPSSAYAARILHLISSGRVELIEEVD